MKLICVRLLTNDFGAMLAFYRDVVKLPLKYTDETGYAYFDVEGAGVELVGREGLLKDVSGEAASALSSAGQRSIMDFQVDDVDQTYSELTAAGAKSVIAPESRPMWGARIAEVSDPEGNIIEIYTSLPQEEPAVPEV